jgi:hypothetical protein
MKNLGGTQHLQCSTNCWGTQAHTCKSYLKVRVICSLIFKALTLQITLTLRRSYRVLCISLYLLAFGTFLKPFYTAQACGRRKSSETNTCFRYFWNAHLHWNFLPRILQSEFLRRISKLGSRQASNTSAVRSQDMDGEVQRLLACRPEIK